MVNQVKYMTSPHISKYYCKSGISIWFNLNLLLDPIKCLLEIGLNSGVFGMEIV